MSNTQVKKAAKGLGWMLIQAGTEEKYIRRQLEPKRPVSPLLAMMAGMICGS